MQNKQVSPADQNVFSEFSPFTQGKREATLHTLTHTPSSTESSAQHNTGAKGYRKLLSEKDDRYKTVTDTIEHRGDMEMTRRIKGGCLCKV